MDNKLTTNDIINTLPLDESTKELADRILAEQDIDKVRDLTHLFNLSQAKRNVLRILKLNNLLDRVSDQMIERFEKRPGEFSNNDLINYLNVTQNAIDRANKSLNLVDEAPAIQFNQLNVNVKEDDVLDKESRERVKDAIKAIMNKLGNTISIEEDLPQEIIVEEKLSEEQDDRVD